MATAVDRASRNKQAAAGGTAGSSTTTRVMIIMIMMVLVIKMLKVKMMVEMVVNITKMTQQLMLQRQWRLRSAAWFHQQIKSCLLFHPGLKDPKKSNPRLKTLQCTDAVAVKVSGLADERLYCVIAPPGWLAALNVITLLTLRGKVHYVPRAQSFSFVFLEQKCGLAQRWCEVVLRHKICLLMASE